MGQILRLCRGQVKPYNSKPQIDWAHPLAAGLAAYCYNADGSIFDLVNGGQFTMGGNGTAPFGSQQTQFGRGLQFSGTGWGFMPPLQPSKINTMGAAAPYSVWMATLYTGAALSTGGNPDGAAVVVQEASNNQNTLTGFTMFAKVTTGFTNDVLGVVYADSTSNFFVAPMVPGTFQTWGASAASTSVANQYANGVFDNTFSGTTIDADVTTPQIMYNTATANAQSFSPGLNGFVPAFAVWGRALSAAEFLLLHQDPYCFLIYPEEEFFSDRVGVSSGGAVNVSLTGVSATAAVGTPTVTGFGNVTLTGVAATAAVGTLTTSAKANITLTGVAATAAVNTPTVTGIGNVTLTGVSATSAVGTLTVSAKANVTLTGVSATTAVNVPTVTAAANVFPTGVAGTTAVNVPTVTGFANVTLSGVAATAAAGTPTVTVGGAINVTLSGVSATAAVGTLGVTGFSNVTLTGVSATSAIGSLTTSAAANASITGVSATAAVNTPTVSGAANVPLTGASATAVANDVTVSVPTGVSVTLTGVGAIAFVGTLTTNLDEVAPVTFGGGSSYRQRDIDQAIREWQEERARARKKFKKKKVLKAVEDAIEVLEEASSKGLLGALPAVELKEAIEELPATPTLKVLIDLREQTKELERLLDEEDEEEIELMALAI